VIEQEEAVGAAGRTQMDRTPRRLLSGRRLRVRLVRLVSLVVIAAVVGVALGLPGRWFGSRPRPITIAVGVNPAGVAVDPAAHRAYVTNRGDDTVSVLDTTRNTVVATIPVGHAPVGVAVDPAAHRAYVANADGIVSVLGMNGTP